MAKKDRSQRPRQAHRDSSTTGRWRSHGAKSERLDPGDSRLDDPRGNCHRYQRATETELLATEVSPTPYQLLT